MLCDEPTSALDLETTKSILELLRDINSRFGITVVLISHEMDVIKSVCTRVAVMDEGRVVEVNGVYELFAAPRHPVTRQLVGHSLNLDVPEAILRRTRGSLVKIVYRGESALEPILANAVRNHSVDINILHGKIEYIGGRPVGALVVNLQGEKTEVEKVIAYFHDHTAETAVIHG